MSNLLASLLLGACSLGGLVLVALGLPGLWVIVAAVCGLALLPGFHAFGAGTIGIVVALAFLGELVELLVGYRLARRYGASKRAGWGALVGGLIGAFVGVPIPLLGSVVGSLLGACVGAAVFEYSVAPERALHAGWGALLGRVAATSAKMAMGMAMAVVAMYSALRG